jgi:uncharacterized protein
VRFWDTSAIVPLLVGEPASSAALRAYADDPDILAWWGTETECASALARLERAGSLDAGAVTEALRQLDTLSEAWTEVVPVPPVRRTARRLVRVHVLRAGDALQLAAAVIGAEGHPASLPFVTNDTRLALAAEREGFPVVRPTAD